ncbi:MAG: hypothetical protein EOO62_17875 [Hymenobacter sp.]|nr:MAG: hypothetical protein EOO62_17875 [Hymenobacter sp.]
MGLRQLKGRWQCVVLGLGLAAASASAQQAPGSRAQVSTIAGSTSTRFEVPQVRLPNATVAKRINSWLLRYARSTFTTVDSTASPQRQLYQASRECCYDKEEKEWMAAGDGLTATTYHVLLNQDYLLSLEFQHDYRGLSELETHHFTFDLRTGHLLALTDLVADAPAQLERRLAAAVSRRLHEELANVVADSGDPTEVAHVASLYGLDPWDTTLQHDLRFDTTAVDSGIPLEFAVRRDAVLLFHPIGMSRLDIPYLPDEKYVFPFSRLHPRGLLVPVAKASVGQGKKK